MCRSSGTILAAFVSLTTLAWPALTVAADEKPAKQPQESKPAEKDPFDVPDSTIDEFKNTSMA